MADEETPFDDLDIGYFEFPLPTTQELTVVRFLDKTGVARLWAKIQDKFFKIPTGGENGQALIKGTGGTTWGNLSDILGTIPISKGGTGATTIEGMRTTIFDFTDENEFLTYIQQADVNQYGVVKFVSNETFCDYFDIDYDPNDWGTEDSGDTQAISLNQLAYISDVMPQSTLGVSMATPTLRQVKYLSDNGYGGGTSYEKLAYISTNGNQWLNTNYYPTSNTRIIIDAQYLKNPPDWACLYGERGDTTVGGNGNQFALWGTSSLRYRSNFGPDSGITAGSLNLERHIYDQNKNILYIDGSTIATHTFNGFVAVCPLYLFACNSHNTIEFPATVRCYSCKIYENNGLVRDFIPARRTSDGLVGMLDQLTDTFYPSVGPSQFMAGPPAGYIQLEYIETNGNAAIDTEYIPQPTTKIEADFIPYTASTFLCGSETDWTVDGIGWVDYIWEYGSEVYNFQSTNGSLVGKGRLTITMDGQYWTCSTGLTHNFSSSITGNNGRSLYIFASHRGDNIQQPGNFRIYSFNIYEDDIPVRKFVPMQRTSDSMAGLYDTVNEKFYTNIASNGVINAGPQLGGALNILPEGYTTLEYIQSSGTQYIVTDYYPYQDTCVDCTFKVDSVHNGVDINGQPVYGSSYGWNNRAFEYWSQAYGFCCYGTGQGYKTDTGVIAGGINNVTQNKNVVNCNGKITSFNYATFTSPLPMLIFGTQRTEQGIFPSSYGANLKIYSLTIRHGTTTVRQFVPCKNNLGVVGMYEIVTNTFYGNSGTGSFIAGPEI